MAKNSPRHTGQRRAKIFTCRKCNHRFTLVGGNRTHTCPDKPWVDPMQRGKKPKGWKKGRH